VNKDVYESNLVRLLITVSYRKNWGNRMY